jgi:hypothetical protein
MVASRCPQRLPFAAFISRSASASVRYSRVRKEALGDRFGLTVRFTVVGAISRRRRLAICFRTPGAMTVRILLIFYTVAITSHLPVPSPHLLASTQSRPKYLTANAWVAGIALVVAMGPLFHDFVGKSRPPGYFKKTAKARLCCLPHLAVSPPKQGLQFVTFPSCLYSRVHQTVAATSCLETSFDLTPCQSSVFRQHSFAMCNVLPN